MPIGGQGDGEAIWHADMTYSSARRWRRSCTRSRSAGRRQHLLGEHVRGVRTCPRTSSGASKVAKPCTTRPTTARDDAQRLQGRDDPRTAPGARHPLMRTHPEAGRESCSSAGGATATSSAWSSTESERCSTSRGRMRRNRNSPFASNGASATCWCGTTAAPCTAATPSTRARAGCCTARRSGPPRSRNRLSA